MLRTVANIMEEQSHRLRVPNEDESWAMEIPLPEDGGGRDGERTEEGESARSMAAYSLFRKIGRGALLALVFLVPIFFLPFTQFPVEASKMVMVSLLILLALISFFVCVMEKRVLEYPRSLVSLAVVIFAAVAGLGTLFSISSPLSLYGKLVQPDSFLAALLYAGAFFLSFYFFTKEDLPKVSRVFTISMVLATLFGFLQMYGVFLWPWSFTKATAFNTFGTTFGWGVFMAAIILAMMTGGKKSLASKIVAVLMGVGLIIVNFQFLWIALACALLVIAAMRFIARADFRKPLILAAIALFFAIVGSRLPTGAATVTEVRPNLQATWSVALNSLRGARLFLGAGPSTFSEEFTRFRSVGLNATNFWGVPFSQGYNFFLTMLSTLGVVGVLSFLFVLFAAVRLARQMAKRGELESVRSLALVLLFLAAMLFFYPGFLTLMLALFVGLSFLLLHDDARGAVSFERLGRSMLFGVFVCAIVLGVISLVAAYGMIEKYAGMAQYADAVTAMNAGNLTLAAAKVQSSVSFDNTVDDSWRAGSQVAFAQAQQLFQQSNGTLNAQTEAAISTALSAAQNAVRIDQNNVYNWEALGTVYQGLIPIANGADTRAIAAFQSAERIDPFNPDLPIAIARVDAAVAAKLIQSAAKLADAETQLQQSINLKPDYATPRFLLAQLYIQEGNVDKAIARVQEIEQQNPLDAGLAFQLGLLYYQNSQTDQAQQEFARAVALNNNYSNARYFLGLIDDQKGNHADAIQQFTAIEQLNPDNAEVKQILANLTGGKPALAGISPPAPAPAKRTSVPVPEASSTQQ